MTAQLRLNAEVSVTGQQAEQQLGRVEGAINRVDQAQRRLSSTSGQLRASTANLGQQIGDISQGLAAGTPIATIYAQQIGQVAFAASGMGGKIGAVATFLSGPWGAAITGATVILGALVSQHNRAGDGAKKQAGAEDDLKKSIDALDRATGLANRGTETKIRLANEDIIKLRQQKQVTLELAQAQLKSAEASLVALQATAGGTGASYAGGGAGAAFGLLGADKVADDLRAKIAGLTTDIQKLATSATASNSFGAALLSASAATSAAAKANQEYERSEDRVRAAVEKGTITEAQAAEQLIAAMKKRDAALAATGEATKAARAAQTEHNRELREGAAAAKEQAEQLDKLAGASGRLISQMAASAPTNADLIARIAADRQRTSIDRPVLDANGRDVGNGGSAGLAEIQGRYTAKGFTDQALTDAVAIGRAIGGSAGSAIQSIAGLAQGAKTGDFNGVPGPIGGILTLLSGSNREGGGGKFSEGLKEAVSQPLSGLKDAFKNVFSSESGQQFAKFAGRAAGGAAVGSTVAGIGNAIGIKLDKTGASIGGAVGGALGPALSKLGGIAGALGPFAGIIGGIAGGLIGGLLAPKGSTTISASGGKISSTGTGNAAVQKATGAIGNTVTDALQSIADQLGGTIGDFSVSIGKKKGQFRVDRSGSGLLNGGTVTGTDSESEALTLALADALRDGGVKVKSPRVQAALNSYADNVNKAVAEALKVKGLEDSLADRKNPFLSSFRTLENQLKQRLDIAAKYGFDLVEIEKINGEDRAKALKDTLASATGSVRSLLTELTIGSRATGSPVERLAGLTKERDRLTALAKGGDTGQLDAIATIIQQIDDLQKSTFGATGGFASGRADSISLLNDLIKQTEDRAKAAADEARATGLTTVDKLTELNATGDDQVALLMRNNALLAQLVASVGGGGTFSFGLSGIEAR